MCKFNFLVLILLKLKNNKMVVFNFKEYKNVVKYHSSFIYIDLEQNSL